jgi:hypothetical protein
MSNDNTLKISKIDAEFIQHFNQPLSFKDSADDSFKLKDGNDSAG